MEVRTDSLLSFIIKTCLVLNDVDFSPVYLDDKEYPLRISIKIMYVI